MKKFYVYIHTCPNGKKYVGITIRKPEYRWRKGEGYKSNKHFYRAIQKYSWDNIDHQVFEVDTKEEMFFLEKYFIAYYQTNNPDFGYNNSIGGESGGAGCHRSIETRHKMSESLKGRHQSIETRHKLSESHKGMRNSISTEFKKGNHPKTEFKKGQKAWNKGIPCSEEKRRKISETLKRRNAIKKELV